MDWSTSPRRRRGPSTVDRPLDPSSRLMCAVCAACVGHAPLRSGDHTRSCQLERPQEKTRPPEPVRAPYTPPRLGKYGALAVLTAAVSMQGNMDGFMGRRTG